MRDEVSANITKYIVDKLNSPVEDSRKQIEKYTETILQRQLKQLECQKSHGLDRGFLSRTREEHEAEVLGCRITVLEEDNEGLKSDKDELEGANIGVQRLVKKLEEENAWQNKYLSSLEGNKRPREGDPETTETKRSSEINSSNISMYNSSTTLTISSSAT